jgi:hypothetical protein
MSRGIRISAPTSMRPRQRRARLASPGDPHDAASLPSCPGVYVFYDVSDRPVYVGKAEKISKRVKDHTDKFWFKHPIVSHGAYVQIDGATLRYQVEQVLIKFLKSDAVINKQSVERD